MRKIIRATQIVLIAAAMTVPLKLDAQSVVDPAITKLKEQISKSTSSRLRNLPAVGEIYVDNENNPARSDIDDRMIEEKIRNFRATGFQLQEPQEDLAPSTEPGTAITPERIEIPTAPPQPFEMSLPSPIQVLPESSVGNDYFTQVDPATNQYDYCACDVCTRSGPRGYIPSRRRWDFGGWLQNGYHSDSTGLLNDRPDELNLHQGWFYAERCAQGFGGWDWGFRIDAVYGTDGEFLQSRGNNPGNFDFQNGFDHGSFAFAIPQLYVELRRNNWGFKFGHLLTEMTYESPRSTNNFFYSRSYSSILGSPTTLTGGLATLDAGNRTWLLGLSAGLDTGFDRVDDGAAFFGGFRQQVGANSTLTYVVTAGDLGSRGDGFAHSFVYERSISCRWLYAFETTALRGSDNENDNVGIANYLIYRWSSRIDFGQRIEWWKSDLNNNGSNSTYAYTFGVNYHANSNIRIRPELRYNWGEQFAGATIDDTIFGIDAIVRF